MGLSPRLQNVLLAASVSVVPLLSPAGAGAECSLDSPRSQEAADRRTEAVRFAETVVAAQETLRRTQGRWGDLSELADIGTPPVGFVPGVTIDAYDYVLLLKDSFDACGFVVVTDSTGIVYEGVKYRPVQPNQTGGRAGADEFSALPNYQPQEAPTLSPGAMPVPISLVPRGTA